MNGIQEELKNEMNQIEVTGMTVTQVMGYGLQKGQKQVYRGVPAKLEMVKYLYIRLMMYLK